jgi:hypothetical protein
MNAPKCTEYDYINFLVAAQQVFSTVEAARSHPDSDADGEQTVAHDAYTRLLQRLPPDSAALWVEVSGCIERDKGMLIIDDTTLDKPYASALALVSRHWSGKHHAVVQGINLISLVWSDGDAALPCDYRLYHKEQDGLSKNDHFRNLLQQANERGFRPSLVAFDSWYSSLENLKLVRGLGWQWLTRLKSNRQVSVQAGQQQAVSELDIPASGLTVHLRGYGFVKVFRTVDTNGNAEHWATSRLDGHERRPAPGAGRSGVAGGGVSPLHQAVHRHRARPVSARAFAAQPYRLGAASVCALGTASLARSHLHL